MKNECALRNVRKSNVQKQNVLYNDVKSCGENLACGVPQGLMIKEFHEVLYKTTTILYADETVTY